MFSESLSESELVAELESNLNQKINFHKSSIVNRSSPNLDHCELTENNITFGH